LRFDDHVVVGGIFIAANDGVAFDWAKTAFTDASA
jgi:hypothetical protein